MIKWGVDEPLSGFRPKMMRIIPLPCRIILYHAESSFTMQNHPFTMENHLGSMKKGGVEALFFVCGQI